MKKLTIVSLFLLALIPLSAQSEYQSGIVDRVQGNDIFVKYDNITRPFTISEKLHINLDSESVTIEVIFPMQTNAKCKLITPDAGKIQSIKKGLIVYDGKPIEKRIVEEKPVEEKVKPEIADSPFKDNGDGTITDTRSGLMWMQYANIALRKMNYNDNRTYCQNLEYAGYNDWHIPTKDEFLTLIELPESNDNIRKLSTYGFIDIQEKYWTSTMVARGGDSFSSIRITQYIYFIVDSNTMRSDGKDNEYYLLPVRSTKKQ